MAKDVIVVRHPEFARLQHQLAVATERFNQATKETRASLVFIASQLTITSEDREDFLEQIEVEEEAYDAIRELHEEIMRLLRAEDYPDAKAAMTKDR